MLYDRDHHDWKIISLYFINNYFSENFHFHSNLSLNLALFDSWYYFVSNSEVPSCIQYNFL